MGKEWWEEAPLADDSGDWWKDAPLADAEPKKRTWSEAISQTGEKVASGVSAVGEELGKLRDSFFTGIDNTRASANTASTAAQAAQLQKSQDKLAELMSFGEGDTPEAQGLRTTIEHYSKRLPRMIGDMTEAQADAQRGAAMTTRPAVAALGEAKTFGEAWDIFKKNPYDVIAGVTSTSLPSTLPALVVGATMGPAAGATAMGGSSAITEAGSSIADFARDSGVDTTDRKAVEAFFANRENLAAAMSYAGKRAGIIGVLDAASGGLAGKTMAPALKSQIARQAVNMPAQMAVQAGMGAGGEAGAQLATKGTIDKPGEVLMEAAGELGGAPMEVAAFSKDARTAFGKQKPINGIPAPSETAKPMVTPIAPVAQSGSEDHVQSILSAGSVDDAIQAAQTAGHAWQAIAPSTPSEDLAMQRQISQAAANLEERARLASEREGAARSVARDTRLRDIGQQWQSLGISNPQDDLQAQRAGMRPTQDGTTDGISPAPAASIPDGGAVPAAGLEDGAGSGVRDGDNGGRVSIDRVDQYGQQPAAPIAGTVAFPFVKSDSGTVLVTGDPVQIRAEFPGLTGATKFTDGQPAGVLFGKSSAPAVLAKLEQQSVQNTAPRADTEAKAAPVETPAPEGSKPVSAARVPAAGSGALATAGVEPIDQNLVPLSKRQRGGRNLRNAAYEKNPLMTFLAQHGLRHANDGKSLKSEFSPDRQLLVSGYGPVFRKTGRNLDELVQPAIEMGYLPPDANEQDLYSLIQRAVAGEKISPLYAEGAEDGLAARYEARQRVEQEAAEEAAPTMTDAEYVGLEQDAYEKLGLHTDDQLFTLDEDVPWEASSNASTADFLRALGATEGEIDDAIANEQASARSDDQRGAGAQEAPAREAQGTDGKNNAGPRSEVESQQDAGLTSPTRADVIAQQERAEAAAKAAAKAATDAANKAKADADRGEFTLTGSDRAADVAAAGGQADIFADAVAETKSTLKANGVTGKDQLDIIKDVKAGTLTAEEVKEAYPTKIEDAGEKIGGARKDRWKDRGLDLSDLDSMSESEGAELATKSNVWKPDYESMANATEPVTAAMVKTVYDQLAAQPKKNTPDGRRKYVEMMQIVRKVYTEAKNPEDVKNGYLKVRDLAGLNHADTPAWKQRSREVYFSVYKGRSDPFVLGYNELSKAKKMVELGFPGKVEPWTKRLSLRSDGGTGVTQRGIEISMRNSAELGTPLTEEQIKSGFWRVVDKAGRAVAYLPTKADAEAAAKTIYERDLKKGASEKVEPVRPNLDAMKRENLAKRIDRDVSAEDFVKDFGFRGVEFGNWAAQDERQRIINMAYDGLMDLAEIMGVPPKAMSLNGTMGMAFGARGGGKFAAHYEPGKLVINMTKINGGGSMAHEWAHALDHYFGELNQKDAYTTKARGASGWYDEQQYKGLPVSRMEKDAEGKWANVTKLRLDNLRPEMAKAFDGVMSALFSGQATKAEMVRSEELAIERYQALAANEADSETKAMYQRGVESRKQYLEELRKEPDDKTYPKGRSAYASEAQKLVGKASTGYWTRPTEMFARAFESWVFDKVTAMGARSDYLVHGVEEDRFAGGGYKGNPYPTGAERANINAAFDKLASTIKTKETDKGVAMFSREEAQEQPRNPFGTPTTVTAIQSAIKELTGVDGVDGVNKLGRIVATTAREIKSTWEPLIGKSVNIESEGDAGAAQGFYDPKSKTIFLIADHIREGAEAAVLAHELMHKHGQSVLGKEGWDRLHSVISSWESAERDSDEWIVYNYARNKVEAVGSELSNQELFPYAVEAALKMGIKPDMQAGRGTVARWLESVRQNLKVVWSKITGKPETFKAQDMVNLAFGIAQMENPELASVANFQTEVDIPDVSDPRTGVSTALLTIGEDDRLYRYPRSNSIELEHIAEDKGGLIEISDVDKSSDDNKLWMLANTTPDDSDAKGVKSWILKLPNGKLSTLTKKGNEVYINVSGVGEGNGGSAIYDLAANFALNNGLVFVGDPNGVSSAAMRRRLENMLSSAIKYGTTDHLKPHPDQFIGDEELGIPPLDWTNGDTLSNIRHMVDVSMAATDHLNPSASQNVRFDSSTATFRDSKGNELDARTLSGLLGDEGRERGIGQGGVSTLQRNALFKSLVQSEGARRAILGNLHSWKARGGDGFGSSLEGTFYSRSAVVGQTNRQHTPEQLRAMKNVGFQVEVPTIKERAQALWKDAGKKLAQGIVDQFAPVKDLDKNAYALLRLSKGSSGAFEAFLKGGKLKLTDGVYDFDETAKGGVIDKLLMPLQGEHHDFMRWVAANRAERLQSEGKENLFSAQDIADLKTLADGTTEFDYTIQTGPGAGRVTRDRTLIYADANRVFNEFSKNVLDMAEQSGLIDGASRKVWEHEFYVPFYRVADEDGGGVRGMSVKGSVLRQQAFKELKGGKNALNSDLLDNTLMNWAHLLDASAKNRAAKATIEAAERLGIATGGNQSTLASMGASVHNKNGVVWFMDGGQKRYSLIDNTGEGPYLMTAINALEYAGMRNPVMNAMGAMKHALTVGVTASPFFKIRNLIRDSVQVIGTSGINANPAANIGQGWRLTDPKSDAYFRLLAGGGTIHFGSMLEGSEAKRVQALVESGVDDATILNSDKKVKAFYRKFIEPGITAYNELGNRGEAINRAALYDQLRKQGLSHADASLQARDLMDFSMQGSSTTIRFLTQVVPFFNARLQGMHKLGRAASEDPARFGAVLGAVAAVSLGLLAAYSDDDDWKKREEWDRNNFWWFKVGGMAFRIPKPFEIGAIATLAERGFELAFDKEMTNKRFMNQVMTLLGDNLSMNPVPQLVKPMLDVYANKDSFSGRPIETMGMDKLKSEYRFTDRTSMTARAISTGLNSVTGVVGKEALSPVQVDSLLRGYFGWLGAFVIGAADIVARPATGQVDRPSSDIWKAATGGMVSDLRDAPSRYVSQMYEQSKELEQAYGTWRALQKQGKVQEAKEFAIENRDKLGRYRSVEAVKRTEAMLNERIRLIERSNKSSDEKRELIRKINVQKDRTARAVAP